MMIDWHLLAEWVLGIAFSGSFTWGLYIRRNRSKSTPSRLTPKNHIHVFLGQIEVPTREAEKVLPYTPQKDILIELPEERCDCGLRLSNQALIDHRSLTGHGDERPLVETPSGHEHGTKFDILVGDDPVRCDVCNLPISGLKRVGDTLSIRHTTHKKPEGAAIA